MIIAYLVTTFLSGLVAVAELFTKFQDEPFNILKKFSSWLYILFNVTVACIGLYAILKTDLFVATNDLDALKAALTAGLGSTILMRSKFLKINLEGKEAAIGPEMLINVFLETLERTIDRDRALDRKQIVEQCMAGIDFDKVKGYTTTTILAASQTVSPEETKALMDEVETIAASPVDDYEKSLALGYLVLDTMGEKFLNSLFHKQNKNRFSKDEQV